jgi:uncharacterized membrane protein
MALRTDHAGQRQKDNAMNDFSETVLLFAILVSPLAVLGGLFYYGWRKHGKPSIAAGVRNAASRLPELIYVILAVFAAMAALMLKTAAMHH